MSQSIVDQMVAVCSLHEKNSAPSDQSGLFTNLDNFIFQKDIDPISPAIRGFTSRQKKKFLQFGSSVNKKMCDNPILHTLLFPLKRAILDDKQSIYNAIDNINTTTIQSE